MDATLRQQADAPIRPFMDHLIISFNPFALVQHAFTIHLTVYHPYDLTGHEPHIPFRSFKHVPTTSSAAHKKAIAISTFACHQCFLYHLTCVMARAHHLQPLPAPPIRVHPIYTSSQTRQLPLP